jgi:hypothetical protein
LHDFLSICRKTAEKYESAGAPDPGPAARCRHFNPQIRGDNGPQEHFRSKTVKPQANRG